MGATLPRHGWDIFRSGASWPVLGAAGCARMCGRIMALNDHWTARKAMENQVHVFHTLGAATYLDPPAQYAERTAVTNPVLHEHFADLYDDVIRTIETATGTPAYLSGHLALPGFHIFRGDPRVPSGLLFGGTVHMDKPHERHRFDFTIEDTLSFTLALSIPDCGAGMYWWRDVPADLLSGPKAPHEMHPEQYAWFDANKSYAGYGIGSMALHDGLTVHQVANPGPTRSDEVRITLQGHGVLDPNGWELFF